MTATRAPDKRTVGRYEIYAEISSGGMATVHLGRQLGHVGFARTVAIKRLHPHVAREPEFVEMFLDEARLATRIHDPHVVPTLDVVAAGGELMLVMEYVHGEALSALLTATARRKERIEPRIAISIAAGMLDGLHAAHEAKNERGEPLEIVHRDVSPQNVLVGADGVARVFDFGIAKAADRLHITQDGSLKGKVAYMSPEQLENEPIDRRSDIWAASVVLWEMLSGRRLFIADSQAALVRMILTKDVPPPSTHGAPAALDAIVLKGLAKNPDERWSTAREMVLALEDALPSAPVRTVAAWVEQCASEELSERAKLLEDVDRVAAAERPSGATRIEFDAILGTTGDGSDLHGGDGADGDLAETAQFNVRAHAHDDETVPDQPKYSDDQTRVLEPRATAVARSGVHGIPNAMTMRMDYGMPSPPPFVVGPPQPPPSPPATSWTASLSSSTSALAVAVVVLLASALVVTWRVAGRSSRIHDDGAAAGSASAPSASESAQGPASTSGASAASSVAEPAPPPVPAVLGNPASNAGAGTGAAAPPPPSPPTPTPTQPGAGATGQAGGSRPADAKRPVRPPPAAAPAPAPARKCTPLDFDYPACLKH